jgi:hypothetical protein
LLVTEQFLRYADTIFDEAPVRHIKLIGALRNVTALAAEPALERLSSLELSFNTLGATAAARFFASPFLGSLRALDLRWNPLSVEGVRALVASPSLTGLRTLELENAAGEAAVQVLASSSALAELRVLNLKDNGLGFAAAQALARSPFLGGLELLDLSDNPIDAQGQGMLRERFGAACRF